MFDQTITDLTRRTLSVSAVGCLVGLPTWASAESAMAANVAGTLSVSTIDQLNAALQRVRGGETILIAPGTYGLLLIRGRHFPSRVTLRAQDLRRPPLFGMVIIEDSSNIVVDSLDCGGAARPSNMRWRSMIGASDSQRVTIRNIRVFGTADLPDGFSRDNGIGFGDCRDIVIENCTVEQCMIGLAVSNVNGLSVVGNKLIKICGDALRCMSSSNALFSGNLVTDFRKHPTIHNDCFQIFTSSRQGPCQNIKISDNVFMTAGPSSGPQGVFIRSETRQAHRNIAIENNLIYTRMWNGINLSNTNGGIIRNNTVIIPPDVQPVNPAAPTMSWIQVGQDSRDILVERNIANNFTIATDRETIQHRDNIQVHRSSTGPRRQILGGVTARSYKDVFGTETLGWTPPRTALIARAGAALTASGSARIGYLG